MVLSTTEWCNLAPSKVVVAKEKKAAAKSDHETKGTGTRRIFSPVFKLQVLDSYRQDADCQGNQRATARKYGIHRRQIQKWLQMETKLRLSVHKSSSALNLSAVPRLDANRSASEEPAPPSSSSSPALTEPQFSSGSVCDSDEYVNVDEISDSEDDGTSSSLSYESRDKALDFTCTALGKHSFPDGLKVLRTSCRAGSCRNNHEGAPKLGIHRHQVQKWVNQEVAASCIPPSETPIEPSSLGTCLDLSSAKRKLGDTDDSRRNRAKHLLTDKVQESALCLVKQCDEPAKKKRTHETHQLGHQQRILYPAATTLEPSYGSLKPEYPFGVYQPWGCCYPQVLSAKSGLGAASTLGTSRAYSYAFNVKYEASYVDIPVQYGFGDSVPSKWLKQNPLFLHSLPSLYPCL